MVKQSRQIWYGACLVVFWLSLASMAWTHRQFTEHNYADPPQQFIDRASILSFGVVPWLELEKRQQAAKTWQTWRIIAPGLVGLALLSLAPAPLIWWLWRRVVAAGRLSGRCDHCSYQSGASNRCPECGSTANHAPVAGGIERFRKHQRYLTPAVMFMGACGIASIVSQIVGVIATVDSFQNGSTPKDTRWVFPVTFAAMIVVIAIAYFGKQHENPQQPRAAARP